MANIAAISIYVEDLEAAVAFYTAGLEFQEVERSSSRVVTERPEPMPGGRHVAVADPGDNVVELLELTP